ncbi:MAG: hypothetical protein K6A76_11525 [Oribacterium sp.]|nr:hypothetical protein [Oribacterium sp.]
MDSQKSIRLKDSKNLSQEEGSGLSALNLYKCRLARYIDEISPDEKAYDTLLPEEVRNKISHADSRAMAESRLIVYENDISSAMLVMRETIEYFINSYEAALEEVKGKAPDIVIITPEEVRKTADMLKRGTKRDM